MLVSASRDPDKTYDGSPAGRSSSDSSSDDSHAARSASDGVADPDLAAIVAAWPTLPAAIRAGLVAIARTACNVEGKP